MKPFQFLLCAAIVGSRLGGSTAALAQSVLPGLRVFTSIEVEFATETNRYYSLQGSSDLQQWSPIGEPAFGNGQVVKRMFSTRSGQPVRFSTYRLEVVESAIASLAPWDLSGQQLGLTDESGTDLLRFSTPTNGLRHGGGDDGFDYTYLKTGENVAELNIVLPEGRSNHVVLQFSAKDQGTFVLEQFRESRLKGRDLGTFRLAVTPVPVDTTTPGEPATVPATPIPPSVPTGLIGRAVSFSAGGEPDRLEFVSATAGWQREDRIKPDDDGGRKAFTYTYAVTSPTQASLQLGFGRGRTAEYELIFTVGEQGSFVRRERRDGTVHDVDRGRFSAAGSVAVSTEPIPTGGSTGTTPPVNPTPGVDTDYWNHGVAPEPGDDKGGTRTDPSTESESQAGGSHSQPSTPGVEANPGGDDHGGHGGGGATVEPGDDHGGTTPEPGDDKVDETAGTTTGSGNSANPPSTPAPASSPATLTGLGLGFDSDVYRFTSDATGNKAGSGGLDSFTYQYQPGTGETATLKVTIKSDRWLEFSLTFTNNGKEGTYTQREFRSGILKAEKQGHFTVAP